MAVANKVLLGWAKEPIVQTIFAASSEENKIRVSVIGYRISVKLLMDMETIAFGYALFVGNCFACTLSNRLDMRDDTLGVLLGFAAIVICA